MVRDESTKTDKTPSPSMRGSKGAKDDKAGRKFSPTRIINKIKTKGLGLFLVEVTGNILSSEILGSKWRNDLQ
ncbi:hypothetical protein GCM10007878_26030 [Marinospirillum insulare]|uniref:Uncharacterized protein n=1 Tax=Marinospirillum insulare TaxID=217169 RepID=A0ABQ5ZYU9_9GAMM|nr:hypothetical protein GCM10007878_26030 [Marinospirillum insulare]